MIIKELESKVWEDRWKNCDESNIIRHDVLLKNILDLFKGKVDKTKILEVGAGTGVDITHLAKNKALSYAIEYSINSIRLIKNLSRKNKVRVNVANADANYIPFGDNIFDVVFSQGVLEHYINPNKLLREQIRVLKIGGYLIVDVPQKYSLYTLKKNLLKLFKKWLEIEIEYTANNLKEIEKKFHLKLIKIYGWGFYPYRLWNIYLPSVLGNPYKKLSKKIESSKFFPKISQCIGAVYQKSANDK